MFFFLVFVSFFGGEGGVGGHFVFFGWLGWWSLFFGGGGRGRGLHFVATQEGLIGSPQGAQRGPEGSQRKPKGGPTGAAIPSGRVLPRARVVRSILGRINRPGSPGWGADRQTECPKLALIPRSCFRWSQYPHSYLPCFMFVLLETNPTGCCKGCDGL